MGLFDRFSVDMGIDLGTCNTLIYVSGRGIVLSQPSVVAMQRGTGAIVAVGDDAKKMLYKTPESIVAMCPLEDGVISSLEATEKMMKYFISRIVNGPRFLKPRMKIGIPGSINEVGQRAVEEAAIRAGAKSVDIIPESLAAAIGAGIPIEESAGHMVCDIGGGTTEVSVISLGDRVVTHTIEMGGNKFDRAIQKYINSTKNLQIGMNMAENLKKKIGNAMADKSLSSTTINGRDALTALPRSIEIDSVEISEALKTPINEIIDVIKQTLSETPPELLSDIRASGIVMTGGGSMLKGFQTLIAKQTGVPVILAEAPLDCVAIGAGKSFEVFREIEKERGIYGRI